MNVRLAVAAAALLVSLTLAGAPVTMADWGEQVAVSVTPTDEADVYRDGSLDRSRYEEVVRYEDLPDDARAVVDRTLADLRSSSPDRYGRVDGSVTIYGYEDAPDRFEYPGDTSAGYALVRDGSFYRLTTTTTAGFPFVYWVFEAPFVLFGLALAWVGWAVREGRVPVGDGAVAAAAGAGFHALGPELDFPVLGPRQFAVLGAVAAAGLLAWIGWRLYGEWRSGRGVPG
ncbi:MAG: hypothetical protein ABEJ42_00230 [Halobacteriaceae archaeon]